jgi:hypothetical protein
MIMHNGISPTGKKRPPLRRPQWEERERDREIDARSKVHHAAMGPIAIDLRQTDQTIFCWGYQREPPIKPNLGKGWWVGSFSLIRSAQFGLVTPHFDSAPKFVAPRN